MSDVASDPLSSLGSDQRVARLREWVLLRGNRLLIAGALFMAFVVAVVVLELFGLVPLASIRPAFYLFGGLVSGNLTLVTVVVTINQLLLSRELQDPGELRSQIAAVSDYRNEIEEASGRVAPVQPLGFLRLLYENTRREAQQLGGLAINAAPETVEAEIDELVERLTEHIDHADELLQQTDPSTINVLSVTLTTNYAEIIKRLRQLRADHGEECPEELLASLDRLVDRLREIDVARQYFKSVYLQEELSALSRILLYAGVPAEVATVLVLLMATAADGTALPPGVSPAVFPLVLGVALLPLFLLASYVLRAATVTQRTAAILPFTTPGQER